MKNLDCNQIKKFYQLRNYRRRRQEQYIYIKKFLQFDKITWHNHNF